MPIDYRKIQTPAFKNSVSNEFMKEFRSNGSDMKFKDCDSVFWSITLN